MRTQEGTGTFDLDTRPKALRYRDQLQAVEQMIVDALPEIVGKLISMSKEGDIAASRYLVDRIYGRTARTPAAPSVDGALPYTAHDFALTSLEHKERRDRLAGLYMKDIQAASAMPGIGDFIHPKQESRKRAGH